MNLQPILYLIIIVSFAVGIIEAYRLIAWSASFLVGATIILQYTVSALKIAFKNHDVSALVLIIIFIVRAVSWTLGGISTGIHFILRKG